MERATGHIASAKHPRKWSKLLECRATFVEPPQLGKPLPPVWITLPDGVVICSSQPDIDRVLSNVLGRDVTLLAQAPANPTREADRTPIDDSSHQETIQQEPVALAAPVGTFFDYSPLHILTTATVNRFRELYPAGQFEMCRFRPNLVVSPGCSRPFNGLKQVIDCIPKMTLSALKSLVIRLGDPLNQLNHYPIGVCHLKESFTPRFSLNRSRDRYTFSLQSCIFSVDIIHHKRD